MESKRTQDLRYSQYASSTYRDATLAHGLQGDPNRQITVSSTGGLSMSIKSNTVDTLSSRPRMSLLPQANDLLQYRTNHLASMPVSDVNMSHSCLRVDTRDYAPASGGAYHPMVEAISPTNEETNTTDDLGTAKYELINQMTKINGEISETEKTIASLKRKQEMLEESASLKAEANLEEFNEAPAKHRSLAQKIYSENKRKAATAHAIFTNLGPTTEFPQYNQPQDASICRDVKKYHETFKERLKLHIKRLKQEQHKSKIDLVEKYSKLSQEWNRRVEKMENNIKRKAREAKSREFFEKVFPELRKQREDKERFNRVGSRIKSEADVEEIIDGLQEQALEDKKMRSYAVIPPLLLDNKQRKLIFFNENGAFGNMEKELKERSGINVWTSGEEEIFREKFLQHPKNFGAISSCLDRKNSQDCVRHYYLSKKRENYKQLLRKSRQRTRSSRNPHKASQNLTPCIIDAMTTGVVTRLQREQQKSGTKDRTNVVSNLTTDTNAGENLQPNVTLQADNTEGSAGSDEAQRENNDPNVSKDTKDHPDHPERNSSLPENSAESIPKSIDETSKATPVATLEKLTDSLPVSNIEDRHSIQFLNTALPVPQENALAQEKLDDVVEESDAKRIKLDTFHNVVSSPVQTVEITTPSKTTSGKFRYTTCTLGSCSNTKERGSRLRNIPSKLFELSHEIKDYISQVFLIPENTTRCCSSCVVRIRKCLRLQRHCAVLGEGDIIKIKSTIMEHGLNWQLLADQLNKPINVVKLFLMLNKKKFEHEEHSLEYSHKLDVNLLDLSEDDSDVSVSSSEEREAISSDTASAESPKASNTSIKVQYIMEDSEKLKDNLEDDMLIPPLNQPPKRQKTQEEYDSSATETADEENEVTSVHQMSPKNVQYPFKSINNTSRDSNVRDIIGNVIEKAIKEKSMIIGPSMKNTSIIDGRSEQAARESFQIIGSKSDGNIVTPQPSNINKASNSFHSNASTNQGPGKMTINCNVINVDVGCDTLGPNNMAFGKGDMDVHTLDLSVKKSSKDMHSSQAHSYQPYIKAEEMKHVEQPQTGVMPVQTLGSYITYEQAEKLKINQSQSCYGTNNLADSSSNSGNMCINNNSNMRGVAHTVFSQQKSKNLSKLSSKPMHHPQLNVTKGSITQGIPVSNPQVINANMMQARYENIFRQSLTGSGENHGSITQGTPLSIGSSAQNLDKRGVFDYYNNKSRMSPSHSQQMSPQSSTTFSSPSFNRAPYIDHPQLSSKQLIMNDYITSQQILGQHRNSRMDKEPATNRSMSNMPLATTSLYYGDKDRSRSEYNRSSPADHNSTSSPQKTPPPQRQGVIRHSKPPSPIKNRLQFSQPAYLSGHEAFSSLVDVASNQPHITIPHVKDDKRCMPMPTMDSSGASVTDDIRFQMSLQMRQIHPIPIQHQQRQQLQPIKNKYLSEYEKERERCSDEMRDKLPRDLNPIMHVTDRELEKQRMYPEDFERLKFKTSEGETECKPFRPQITSRGDTTFTAASLINAIITHQISQTNTNEPPMIRESFRHTPQFIPIKENQSSNLSIECGKARSSPNVINVEVDPDSSSSSVVTKMKFGDLADSIINKDYGPSAANQLRLKNILPNQYQSQEAAASSSHDDQWKHSHNKRVIGKDDHESPIIEKQHFSDESNAMKSVVPASPRNHSLIEPISPPESSIYDKRVLASQSSEFALDCYVKSRIAEAMRTESDKRIIEEQENKRGMQNQTSVVKDDKVLLIQERTLEDDLHRKESNEPRTQPTYNSASYTYPFSALSMSSSSSSAIPISQVQAIQNPDKQSNLIRSNVSNIQKVIQDEPKPLLSSKYEALSDED